jgi:hypothetical protein
MFSLVLVYLQLKKFDLPLFFEASVGTMAYMLSLMLPSVDYCIVYNKVSSGEVLSEMLEDIRLSRRRL